MGGIEPKKKEEKKRRGKPKKERKEGKLSKDWKNKIENLKKKMKEGRPS